MKESLNTKSFTYIFQVSGQCRECGKNVRLFGQTVRRGLQSNLLSGDFAEFKSANHHLREDLVKRTIREESCDGCPTVDDFLLFFNDTITDLQAEGSLVNVVSVTKDLAELETVNCMSEVTEFETTANVTFRGDPDMEPSDAELESLATAFGESYNSANALNGEI